MPSVATLADILGQSLSHTIDRITTHLPSMLIAAAVAFAGWLLAKALSMAVERLIIRLDGLWHKLIAHLSRSPHEAHHLPASLIGTLVFWLLMLLTFTAAADVLGFNVFITWLKQLAAYLPVLFAGLLIIMAGLIAASLVRNLTAAAAASAHIQQADMFGRVAQGVVLASAFVIGVQQMGLDISFLVIITSITLGAMLGGMALAFGLGAKTIVSNALAVQQLRQLYEVGDAVKVHGLEGKILEITTSAVVLDTGKERVTLPARLFCEEPSALIGNQRRHETR